MFNSYLIIKAVDYIITKGKYETTDLLALIKLFDAAYPSSHKFSVDFLRWQYLDNPNGIVVSFNAWTKNGEMAAHYAAIPVEMMIGGKVEKGLLSLNTATHPLHQGKRLFTRLASQTYDYAKEHGYKYVIGVANANSTHGFLKYLGFYQIAPLDVKVGIGDVYARPFDTSKNRMYYNEETMRWRLACPQFHYSYDGDTIYGSIDKPLFNTVVARMPEYGGKLSLPKKNGVFALYVGLGIYIKGCYVNLPKFIKRSPFNLIFKDLTDGDLPVMTKDNIIFQLLDYDVA